MRCFKVRIAHYGLGHKYNRITTLQTEENSLNRIINLSNYNAHTEPIYKSLKLLKIQYILNYKNIYSFKKLKTANTHTNTHTHTQTHTHTVKPSIVATEQGPTPE